MAVHTPPNPNFVQCPGCKRTLFSADLEENMKVCPNCGHHHRLGWEERAAFTFDTGTFEETNYNLTSGDPLEFPEYEAKYKLSQEKSGMRDSVVTGMALLGGQRVSTAIADFRFMGGSMGSVAGEKVTRALEAGVNEKCPVIVFCASGGARMQEGMLSLMQMAKTTAAVEQCREQGIPYIAVFTDPTMAGVLASYASIADVIIAEPKALVGFAGARVSKQAQVVKPPADFQTAEYVLRVGMIDKIVPRKEMRQTLISLTDMLGSHLRSVNG